MKTKSSIRAKKDEPIGHQLFWKLTLTFICVIPGGMVLLHFLDIW